VTERNLPFSGDVSQAWEDHAAEWLAWARAPGHDSYWQFHRDQFLEIVPPPGRLTVDLGCGEGRLSGDLSRLGHRVVGIDASPTLVAAAREAHPAVEFHVMRRTCHLKTAPQISSSRSCP
jgi:2-polyprenyl-3-methyl-5-hydroxy-6-metoxy-1,4-benzoquinol methylase